MKLSSKSLALLVIAAFGLIALAAWYISAAAWWNHATIQ